MEWKATIGLVDSDWVDEWNLEYRYFSMEVGNDHGTLRNVRWNDNGGSLRCGVWNDLDGTDLTDVGGVTDIKEWTRLV